MLRISFKAIIIGCISWVALVGVGLLVVNYITGTPTNPISWIAYSSLWAIPGYIAATISNRSGLLHGAIVGLIAGGTVSAIIDVLFPSQNNIDSASFSIVFLITTVAVFWSSVGGLIFDFSNSSKDG